jgi:hypothetical protein
VEARPRTERSRVERANGEGRLVAQRTIKEMAWLGARAAWDEQWSHWAHQRRRAHVAERRLRPQRLGKNLKEKHGASRDMWREKPFDPSVAPCPSNRIRDDDNETA